MRKIVLIEGMSCGHCVMHVTDALEKVPGVTRAKVDLKTNQAVIEGEAFNDEALKTAVTEAGYEALAVREI